MADSGVNHGHPVAAAAAHARALGLCDPADPLFFRGLAEDLLFLHRLGEDPAGHGGGCRRK